MRNNTSVTISLPESQRQFVENEVEAKGYGNVSEYFRALVRDAQARTEDARVEALLLEGLLTGEDIEVTSDFWKELRSDAARLLRERSKG